MKLMFVGAHPDDGDIRVSGLAMRHIAAGGEAVLVSLTNGNAGHHTMQPDALATRRKEEARRAGAVIGADYMVLDHDDGRLTPSVEIREELIGIIRRFDPDLLLGLRPCDYHPDHRAAGQLVLDCAYLLTVPLIRPDVPIMSEMPVIGYVYDSFRQPAPFRPDVVVAVDEYAERKLAMIACHESQFFEWMPYNSGFTGEVPTDADERLRWLGEKYGSYLAEPAERYREELVERYGPEQGSAVRHAEVFEISEYGRQPNADLLERLFPP